MARVFALVGILGSIAVVAAAQAVPASVTISWLGQATFVMSTSTGLRVLLDPTNPGAYNPSPVSGIDVVTLSHEHGDHNYVQLATGSPLVLHGLTSDDFATIDQTIKGVRIRTVPTYHDPEQGAKRGKNAVFVFEVGGLRIAQLGDLGHRLDAQQVAKIGPVDILMTEGESHHSDALRDRGCDSQGGSGRQAALDGRCGRVPEGGRFIRQGGAVCAHDRADRGQTPASAHGHGDEIRVKRVSAPALPFKPWRAPTDRSRESSARPRPPR
jgi:hypothetical protein